MKFILGLKLGMTQVFDQTGKTTPVTLVAAGPCQVLQIKTKAKDGYEACQVGFVKIEKRIQKSQKTKPFRFQREAPGDYKINDIIDVSVFQEGDKVKITGVSKGKGFQGAVKLWNFSGRNASHGVKHEQRTLGSIGSTDAERVFKGKKMPGRMGGERVTVKNLKVVKVDKENNILAIKGAVPGPNGTLLQIRGNK
ncbi:MAG: 50S ribosomal protein L3 [Candidatus Nealsonbacteria bacterium]|nr:50S ribosomal protein L3 [Candidatus Nealsonbacteria bacterium]